jgi:FtsH-binding integral membrane protein
VALTSRMDWLYSTPSWQLAITLFVFLLGGMFVGFSLGKNAARHGEQESGAADSAVKGAVAGLAALLLAFSFSLAAGRYDQRNTLVLREANALRDAWLRTDLLEEPTRGSLQQLLRDYLDARLKYIGARFDPTQIGASAMASQQLQQQIWQVISEQSRINPQPRNVSTMVPAVNEMIDAGAAIEAAYSNTVPAIVLILLFAAIVFTGLLVGHSFGRAGRRHVLTAVVFALLVTLVVSVILDLDRPRRGVIRENFGPLENLRTTVRPALSTAQ